MSEQKVWVSPGLFRMEPWLAFLYSPGAVTQIGNIEKLVAEM
jgi:hypothetical protein